jgi:hypothetical protein
MLGGWKGWLGREMRRVVSRYCIRNRIQWAKSFFFAWWGLHMVAEERRKINTFVFIAMWWKVGLFDKYNNYCAYTLFIFYCNACFFLLGWMMFHWNAEIFTFKITCKWRKMSSWPWQRTGIYLVSLEKYYYELLKVLLWTNTFENSTPDVHNKL